MSDAATLNYLSDRDRFVEALKQGLLPTLDFSNAALAFDFSGLRLSGVNFAFCKLAGSNFSNCYLHECHFDASDWKGANFSHATFNGCYLSGIDNAHKASGLDTVRGNGILMNFETARRPWWNRFLDWEMVQGVGKLPLFTASSAALVLLPIYFYLIDTYNQHLLAWQKALSQQAAMGQLTAAADVLNRLKPLPIPDLSLASLASAILLFIASAMFAILCPARIKQFSKEQWCNQLQRSIVEYWPLAWKHSFLRLICIGMYVLGGGIAAYTIAVKLFQTVQYVWRNT